MERARGDDDGLDFAAATVDAPLPFGFHEDLRAPLAARAHGVAERAARELAGDDARLGPTEASGAGERRAALVREGVAPALGVTREALRFGPAGATLTGVACRGDLARCDAALERVALPGSPVAPPPSPVLGAVAVALHHPTPAAALAAGAAFAVAFVAARTRRRPRTRSGT